MPVVTTNPKRPSSGKTYRCPGCDQEIASAVAQVIDAYLALDSTP